MGRSNSTEALCEICGDRSYGRHYGLWTCDGCSCFFKRSVRKKMEYKCITGLNDCVIDRTRRNWCPSCRLTKCRRLNMNAEAVQNERGPRRLSKKLNKIPAKTIKPKNIEDLLPKKQSPINSSFAEVNLSIAICRMALTSAWASSILAFSSDEVKTSILSDHYPLICTLFSAANVDIWLKSDNVIDLEPMDLDNEELRLALCYLLCSLGVSNEFLTFAYPLVEWYKVWIRVHCSKFGSPERATKILSLVNCIVKNEDKILISDLNVSDLIEELVSRRN